MDKNINIAPKEIAPGVFSTGGTATMPVNNPLTNQPNVITPQALQPTTPINLAGTTPAPTVDTSLVANATQNATNFDTQAEFQRQLDLQKQTTPDQTSLNNILASLTASEQGLTGRGAEQLTAETTAGIPEAQKQRSTLQGQIKTQLAEYNAMKADRDKLLADLEVGTRGTGNADVRTSVLLGQQGAVERQYLARLNSKASEIGLLQAQDEALKGDIETAQNTVNRAIDLKYQDKEAEYQIKKLQYDRIKDSLTAEEKKRGEAMQNALKKEETILAEAKENEKAISKMIIDATPNAPANVIANAKAIADKGGSTLEVAQALGKYGGDYLKTELLKQQIETEKAQRSKIYTDIAKTKSETLGTTGKPLSGEASKLLAISGGLKDNVAKIQAKIDKVGYKQFLQGYLLGTDRETVKLLSNAADQVGRLRSGGAINKDEEKRFLSQFASTGDYAFGTAEVAKNALNSILTEAETVNRGIDPTGAYSTNPADQYFNLVTGSLQTVNNQVNNKEKNFLMTLTPNQ